MPRWLRWSLLALLSWGIWAIMAKLIGDRLSGAQNQALSTLGILPIMLVLGVSRKSSATGNRRCGIFMRWPAVQCHALAMCSTMTSSAGAAKRL